MSKFIVSMADDAEVGPQVRVCARGQSAVVRGADEREGERKAVEKANTNSLTQPQTSMSVRIAAAGRFAVVVLALRRRLPNGEHVRFPAGP